MREGKLVVPMVNSVDDFSYVRLLRRHLEKFELGFDESSILEGQRIVVGLLPGSRAEEAGIRNGDQVEMIPSTVYNEAKESVKKLMKLKVTRDGQEPFIVEYLPRSREQVEAYRYETVENKEL